MTAPAIVEAQPDPNTPGRTAYRITSLYSPAAVQQAVADIEQAFHESVAGPALSEFTPVRKVRGTDLPDLWMSLGHTTPMPVHP